MIEINDIVDNLDRLTTRIDWGSFDFGESVMKAELKKQLFKIKVVDSSGLVHLFNDSKRVAEEDIMYITTNGVKTYEFFYGEVGLTKGDEPHIYYKVEKNFPAFAKLVIDYLIGSYTFSNSQLYDVRFKQFRLLDEFTLQTKYGFKESAHILEILMGIHNKLNVRPIKFIEPYQIACEDFIIDLQKNEVLEEYPKQNVSYFKYYPVPLEVAVDSKAIAKEFLDYVINDENSLSNAKLQAYYIAQVACGVRAKTNFFISKSGVRTGKGLRHITLSGLFNKIDVELDTLKSNGFEALQAWSMFSGGEMALATEQGDIQGESTERILKIIATEKTHVARAIGQNQSFVNLTSVLCVDTNRTVALSDEMDGRKVLIQFKDRPKNETDIKRERIFKKYWDVFTTKDKNPDISGCIGFLLNSLDYFNELEQMYVWKNVEVFNDIDLDDFQTALINALQEIEFVQRTDNEEVIALSNQVYGKNMNALNKSLSEIGVEAISKKINGKKVRGYSISNKDRFNKFIDE